MQDIKLIQASRKDIPNISGLAKIIWNQHYPAIINHEQIAYMLNLMYSEISLKEQMETKGHSFFLIQQKTENIGFISVNLESKNDWFLNKFYINQELATKGIGRVAFSELLKIIAPKKITLTVNRQNFKSVNFYFKLGFKIERIADFDIGNGYVMNDFVMTWEGSPLISLIHTNTNL
ncbi:GNAT family N-acetyltransferase [Aurantibacillus circumpalustris]|uniref:GNAT family N-acetyltransferase n=1 Tax=Aurantibacillus circumpalustris TaxID=3036359 RepID=UPI00295B8EC3|nr:GNAT family N-acetyltransferase [Aurantibacillus circumpalustris]